MQVFQTPGGVGRNIAEAAHHILQQQQQHHGSTAGGVLLISVLGCDAAADALLASFSSIG